MLGPKTSVSRTPLRWPRRAKARARLTAIIDFPTPSFAEEMVMTLRTERMGRFKGRSRCWRRGREGDTPEGGRP